MDKWWQFPECKNSRAKRGHVAVQCRSRTLQKKLFMRKHLRKELSLATHYVKTQGHLIGPNIEIWEYDEDGMNATRVSEQAEATRSRGIATQAPSVNC